MIVYHGTTKTNLCKIVTNGFEGNGRWIMFAEKKEEALRYAKSYAGENDQPALITLDLEGWNIISDIDFYEAKRMYEDGKIDGILSDTFERNKLSDYFVIFNILKLNLMKEKITFPCLRLN